MAQVLPWRPRRSVSNRQANTNSPSSFLTVGAYAGRATFRPSARAALTPALEKAVGKIVEVGYAGVIDYDHALQITGDQPLPKQYIAFAVGYMRALLQGL